MDIQLVRLIGAYLFGLIVLGFGGYMMVTTGTIPDPWADIMSMVLGALLIVDGIERTVRRRNNRG